MCWRSGRHEGGQGTARSACRASAIATAAPEQLGAAPIFVPQSAACLLQVGSASNLRGTCAMTRHNNPTFHIHQSLINIIRFVLVPSEDGSGRATMPHASNIFDAISDLDL